MDNNLKLLNSSLRTTSKSLSNHGKKSCEKILKLWKKKVKDEIYSARKQIEPILINSLPELLENLMTLLKTSAQKKIGDFDNICKIHGTQRARNKDYTLDEVLREYIILRKTIFEVLDNEGPLTSIERDIISSFIEEAMQISASQFMQITQEDLREKELRFKLVIEGVTDFAFIRLDPYGIIADWSKGAEALTGYSKEEAIGKRGSIIFTPEDLANNKPNEEINTALREGKATDNRWHMKKDGTRFFVNGVMNPLINEEGKLQGFIKVMQDFTKRKQVEDELTKTRKELELKIEQTHNYISQLEIEHTLREKFIATLTHDLRTPLTSIQSNADLLIYYSEYDPEIAKISNRLAESVDRIDKMINSLLDLGRIKAGKPIPIDVTNCDLEVLIKKVISEFQEIYGKRFVTNIYSPLIGFWSEDGIRRILENLITNAIKYGESNHPITISGSITDGHVLLSVHNEGPEIPLEDRKHLFESFHRSEKAKHSHAHGWGLGLSLVKALTEAHGGEISVVSTKESGTTFTVKLPLNAAPYQI